MGGMDRLKSPSTIKKATLGWLCPFDQLVEAIHPIWWLTLLGIDLQRGGVIIHACFRIRLNGNIGRIRRNKILIR
jgi:hypothetical protein